MNRAIITAAACTLSILATPAARAQERAESVKAARLYAARECPITPDKAIRGEATITQELAPLVGALLAGVAGGVAKAGLNAVADSLEAVSKEKGFVAEGSGSFAMSRVVTPAESRSALARVVPKPICLVLYQEGSSGSVDDFVRDPKIHALAGKEDVDLQIETVEGAKKVTDSFRDVQKFTHLPKVYVEAQLLQGDEGLVIRPVLVWYRERLAGAPSGKTAAEFHLSLATPGGGTALGDIGTVFAGARMVLPRLAPGTLLDWDDLRFNRSMVVASRPSAGFVDTKLAAFNAAYAVRDRHRSA